MAEWSETVNFLSLEEAGVQGSNPGVATSRFFFSFHRFFTLCLFLCLFSQLTLLASRDFWENVFLVIK